MSIKWESGNTFLDSSGDDNRSAQNPVLKMLINVFECFNSYSTTIMQELMGEWHLEEAHNLITSLWHPDTCVPNHLLDTTILQCIFACARVQNACLQQCGWQLCWNNAFTHIMQAEQTHVIYQVVLVSANSLQFSPPHKDWGQGTEVLMKICEVCFASTMFKMHCFDTQCLHTRCACERGNVVWSQCQTGMQGLRKLTAMNLKEQFRYLGKQIGLYSRRYHWQLQVNQCSSMLYVVPLTTHHGFWSIHWIWTCICKCVRELALSGLVTRSQVEIKFITIQVVDQLVTDVMSLYGTMALIMNIFSGWKSKIIKGVLHTKVQLQICKSTTIGWSWRALEYSDIHIHTVCCTHAQEIHDHDHDWAIPTNQFCKATGSDPRLAWSVMRRTLASRNFLEKPTSKTPI